MIFQRKLVSYFFDAVDGTNLNAKSAEGTAPIVDVIIGAIRNNGIFRTDEFASIAGYANRGDFQAHMVHNSIIRQIRSGTIKSQKERRDYHQHHDVPWSIFSFSLSAICLPPPTLSILDCLF